MDKVVFYIVQKDASIHMALWHGLKVTSQKKKRGTFIHIYTFFKKVFSHVVYHRLLNIVLCAI